MTKRIFRSIFAVAVAVGCACFVLFLGVLYDYFGSIQAEQLKTDLAFAAAGVERSGEDYLNSLRGMEKKLTLNPTEENALAENRLTWIDAQGTVLFDSKEDAADMENHADREEIKEALISGEGVSSRYSVTRTEQTLYYAKKLSDGTVLRISVSRQTTIALVLVMFQPILIVLAIAFVLSGILANRLSKNIVKPLEAINYARPLESETYEELTPILKRMEQQHQLIRSQSAALEEREKEFYTIVSKMNEGLVLLNHKGEILSMNPAAEGFFQVHGEPVGRDLTEVEQGPEVLNAIENAKAQGYSEQLMSRNGREYMLRVSRVQEAGGIVILVFDITERVFAERNRREFTANVSHELKTPLQTILGSTELLEHDLVRPEDVPMFIGRIRSEAERLVNLIEDIIRLSQLDEKSSLPVEEVDLAELVRNEVEALRSAAEAKHITIEVAGETKPVMMQGVRQLLHEIVYNLCDNAIKYNVDGGRVTVTVGKYCLKVKDTGIGIAPEHHERIFERFYRVDKSHSRNIGGTGLGLSIVKHAAECMDGRIEVLSAAGEGTEIAIVF